MGAEDSADFGVKNPGSRIAIIGPTYQHTRDTCVEGESGLLACIPESFIRDWNRSIGELTLANGSFYRLFTGEKPSALRGPQHHRIWADELPHWRYPEDVWDMAQLGLRLGKNPQSIVTSTPLPIQLIRDLLKDPSTIVVRGTTYDNRANLPVKFFEKIIAKYEGTRLGQQELYAEVLDEFPGALWSRADIDRLRWKDVKPEEIAARCRRIVVAIDPAVTDPRKLSADKNEDDIAETGIVAVGILPDGEGVVLADDSCRDSPQGWGRKAVNLYKRFHADRIIGETNNGGDLVEEVIRIVDPNISYRSVKASKGKYKRAEPIAALYEQKRIHHVGTFLRLEDQMCMFTPEQIGERSPDRADALVWGLTELFDGCMNLGLLSWQKEQSETKSKVASQPGRLVEPVQSCACGSLSIAKVPGGFRCSQCGTQLGHAAVMVEAFKRSDALKGVRR